MEYKNDMSPQLNSGREVTKRKSRTVESFIPIGTSQLTKALQREHLIRHIIALTNQSSNMGLALQAILQEIGEFLDADRCILLCYNKESHSPTIGLHSQYCRSGIPNVDTHIIPPPLSTALDAENGEQIVTSLSTNASSPDEFPEHLKEYLEQHRVQSVLIFNFYCNYCQDCHCTPCGSLILHQCQSNRIWTQDEIDLLHHLVVHLGITLYHAELFQQEQKARREAEAAKENYQQLVDGVKDYAIVMLSPLGFVTSWGMGAERIKGYKQADILGHHVSCFYTTEDIQQGKPEKALKIAVSQGRYEDEGWRIRQDGSQFWANVVITPIYNERGLLLGFFKITRDITERREMETQLAQAKETAIHANQRKNQFLASISHELRTPLHTMISASGMMLEEMLGPLSEKQTEYLSLINHSGEHLLQIINDLLDVAKIEAGKFTINPHPIDLLDFIEHTRLLVEPLLDEKRQRFVLTLEDGLPLSFYGDAIRLKQVLCNLLSNANKFAPVQSVIELQCSFDNGNLIFAVRDEGPGISQPDLERILLPFEQGIDTYQGHIKGTGLGLPLAKKIIELHHGTLEIKTQVGQGSTFSVSIPHTQNVSSSGKIK